MSQPYFYVFWEIGLRVAWKDDPEKVLRSTNFDPADGRVNSGNLLWDGAGSRADQKPTSCEYKSLIF